ncbi:MAG: hypothetical protein JF615_09290 [Asticcacaulis sp.]|nr:hypothetical protein [Asticcacaulis sp.]
MLRRLVRFVCTAAGIDDSEILDPAARRPSALERQIVVAIRELAANPKSRARAITLNQDPWFDMLLAPAHGQPISAGPTPAVIAYVHGDNAPTADRCEQLVQLFALTPSEARLALALSRGMTIAEAAAEFGLTLETARNYSSATTSLMISKSRANFRGLLFHAVAVALPLGIFAYFYHWQILIPTNATWLLSGDWGANVIGWNALRHDDWHWPLGFTRLLAWPNGVPITYTDSNPLLCLLLKPFSAILPTPFQFTGPWLLSCIVLQFAAAYALLRGDGRDRWLRLLGATLLTVVPTLINRMGHANLCAHWTILLSLYAFIHVQPEGRRDLWYGAILAISALVHPYLLLMNAAIWASDLMRRYIGLVRSRDLRGLFGLAARTAAVAAAPVVALWASGALGGYEGDGGGFGFYSMALDALFNPGFTGYSRFLPVKPQGDGQYFEGLGWRPRSWSCSRWRYPTRSSSMAGSSATSPTTGSRTCRRCSVPRGGCSGPAPMC